MKRLINVILIFLISISSLAQDKKTLNITRTSSAPKIDGILDDVIWQHAEEAKGFTQFKPKMGVNEENEFRTIVKITYDDEAIYIGAYLYDDPSKIMRQLTVRDNFGQSDFFGVVLNPNNDAQNNTEFFVFSSGTQADAIATPSNGEDFGWNAVWNSAVKMNDDGWVVEMKIPYRTLRFSNQEVQTWGLQFHRHFRRDRSQYTWNPVDVTKGNIGLYHGELKGIKNIEPPTRLNFYPFASTFIETYHKKTTSDFTLGLDVKYGISENFTIDATLIPDFSQAGFDDLELNLGPFEQTFSEQRQFFKEGVELFNKGDLFYTRRIGNNPVAYDDVSDNLGENEEIKNTPENIKMLNAIKFSGRTKKGLGIAFFNAITEKTEAEIKDTITNETRTEVVEPFANYNVFVLDQQFNKNSSVSLINTNVTRNGYFKDANVTALLADIRNKKNTYGFEAKFKVSSLNLIEGNQNGFSSEIEIGKISGNFQYEFEHKLVSKDYDINDLGINFRNNFSNFTGRFSYRIFKPTKKLNSFKIDLSAVYKKRQSPSTYQGNNVNAELFVQTKTLFAYGIELYTEIGKQYDYNESREDKVYIYENWLSGNAWFSSNYNKPFALDGRIRFGTLFENGRDLFNHGFRVRPRIRFNDNFILIYSFDYNNNKRERGFVNTINDYIIFGERNQVTIENSISGNYTFNSFHSLSLTFRNYWSTVTYDDDLYTLQQNGKLTQNLGYTVSDLDENPNINFSTWNLDFKYSWEFAPGSFLTALYRNQLFNQYDTSKDSYSKSLSTLFDQPIQHTFSLRLQYFIDYNNAKKLLKKKTTS